MALLSCNRPIHLVSAQKSPYPEVGDTFMAADPRLKYSTMTSDGRAVVDVNRLYRSKQVQDLIKRLNHRPQADSHTAPDPASKK
jgi:hypothetical protein